MTSLGELHLDLSVETARFVSGLSDAARVAQTHARGIAREFSSLQRVASQTFGAFGSFNPIISQMSFAISSGIGAVNNISSSFQKLGREMGATAADSKLLGLIGLGLGAIAGASIAAATGLAALSIQGAEVVRRLDLVSQKTGISIRDLQTFEAAGKTVGVSLEDMTQAMRKFDQSITGTARNSGLTTAVLAGLGVTARDNKEALLQVADAFAAMEDGPRKAADAVALFGRAGLNMIPWLNKGREGILEFEKIVDEFGPHIGKNAITATDDWEKSTLKLSLAWDKFKVSLSGILTLTASVTSVMAEATSATSDLVSELAQLKPGAWQAFISGFASGGIQEAITRVETNRFVNENVESGPAPNKMFATMDKVLAKDQQRRMDKSQGDFELEKAGGPAELALEKQREDIAAAVQAEHYDIALALQKQIPSLEKAAELEKARRAASTVPSMLEGKNGTEDLIAKLQAQASAEMGVASATNASAASILLQKSAGEADVKMTEVRTSLLDKEAKLRQQLAIAQGNPKAATEVARVQAEIAGNQKLLEQLSGSAPKIRALQAEIATGQEAAKIGGEFSTEGLDYSRQISSLEEFVAAYSKGGSALAAAEIEQKLEKDKQAVAELQELLAKTSPITAAGTGPSKAYADTAQSLANANQQLSEHRAQLENIQSLNIQNKILSEAFAFDSEASAIRKVNAAHLESSSSVRTAEIEVKVAQFTTENKGAGPQDIAAVRELYKAQAEEARNSAAAQEASQFEVGREYEDTIDKLTKVRELLVASGHSTMMVDFAIDQASADKALAESRAIFNSTNDQLISHTKIYDAQRAELSQWDEMVSKVGTAGDRFHALANEIALEGQNLGQKLFDSFDKAIDGIEDQIAKLVVTGRSDFRKMFEGIAEGMVKQELKWSFGTLAGFAGKPKGDALHPSGIELANLPINASINSTEQSANAKPTVTSTIAAMFGVKLPGAKLTEAHKPTGNPGDPIYVAVTNSLAGASAGAGISQKLGTIGTGTTPPFFPLPGGSISPIGPEFSGATSSTSPVAVPGISEDWDKRGGGALQQAGSIARVAGAAVPGPGGQTLRSVTSTISPVMSLIKMLEQHSSSSTALKPAGNVLSSLPIPKGALPDFGSLSSTLPSDTGSGASESAADSAKAIQGAAIAGQDNSTTPQLFGPNGPTAVGTAVGLAGAGLSLTSSILKFIQLLTPRETGGPVSPGHAYIVGEKRPEIFFPGVSGHIHPNTNIGGAGGGDQHFNHVEMNVHTNDADSFQRSRGQILGEMHRELDGMSRRY